MKTLDAIKDKAIEFQGMLEQSIPKDDPEACIGRITEIEIIMVESGKLLSDARFHQDNAQCKLKEIIAEIGADISPSTLNAYVKARTANENYLVNWMERINRSATHLLENLRTCVSFRKEEMKNLNYKT